ncbi:MAG: TPM domain-containing protein [Sedimentisphaerales bacterium]|nr:TPM domain-containing protein [Sedimentisphaerales bacterium]
MRKNLLILSVATMLPATLAAARLAVPNLPMPQEYVDDLANVITAEQKHSLNAILQELEQKTGVQYIILTVETTGGIPIEEYSIELAHNRWKLGQKDKDNGLLFAIAVKDRAYRFEVGYGLEGTVTDRFAGQIGRDVLVPYLKKGQYSEGIYEANLRIVQRIAQAEGVQLTGMPNLPAATAYNPAIRTLQPCCGFLIPLFLALIIFAGMGRGGRGGGGWWWLLLPFLFHRGGGYGYRRPYGPFGGGFGGFGGGFGGGMRGGFGHFGGGGGGGFGGGGAGGHW